jgi:hypothetical protein
MQDAVPIYHKDIESNAAGTVKIGEKIIKKHLEEIPNMKIREKTKARLKQLEAGERDLYF